MAFVVDPGFVCLVEVGGLDGEVWSCGAAGLDEVVDSCGGWFDGFAESWAVVGVGAVGAEVLSHWARLAPWVTRGFGGLAR